MHQHMAEKGTSRWYHRCEVQDDPPIVQAIEEAREAILRSNVLLEVTGGMHRDKSREWQERLTEVDLRNIFKSFLN